MADKTSSVDIHVLHTIEFRRCPQSSDEPFKVGGRSDDGSGPGEVYNGWHTVTDASNNLVFVIEGIFLDSNNNPKQEAWFQYPSGSTNQASNTYGLWTAATNNIQLTSTFNSLGNPNPQPPLPATGTPPSSYARLFTASNILTGANTTKPSQCGLNNFLLVTSGGVQIAVIAQDTNTDYPTKMTWWTLGGPVITDNGQNPTFSFKTSVLATSAAADNAYGKWTLSSIVQYTLS